MTPEELSGQDYAHLGRSVRRLSHYSSFKYGGKGYHQDHNKHPYIPGEPALGQNPFMLRAILRRFLFHFVIQPKKNSVKLVTMLSQVSAEKQTRRRDSRFQDT